MVGIKVSTASEWWHLSCWCYLLKCEAFGHTSTPLTNKFHLKIWTSRCKVPFTFVKKAVWTSVLSAFQDNVKRKKKYIKPADPGAPAKIQWREHQQPDDIDSHWKLRNKQRLSRERLLDCMSHRIYFKPLCFSPFWCATLARLGFEQVSPLVKGCIIRHEHLSATAGSGLYDTKLNGRINKAPRFGMHCSPKQKLSTSTRRIFIWEQNGHMLNTLACF